MINKGASPRVKDAGSRKFPWDKMIMETAYEVQRLTSEDARPGRPAVVW